METFSEYLTGLLGQLPLEKASDVDKRAIASFLSAYLVKIFEQKDTSSERKTQDVGFVVENILNRFEMGEMWTEEVKEKVESTTLQSIGPWSENWDESPLYRSLLPPIEEDEEVEIFSPENVNLLLRVFKVIGGVIVRLGEMIITVFDSKKKKEEKKGKEKKKKDKKKEGKGKEEKGKEEKGKEEKKNL